MTSVLRRLREASATPGCAVGSLSAILDLEPETGGDDDYAEVGRKRASRQLGGLVPGSPLVGSDLRAWHRSWSDYGQLGTYRAESSYLVVDGGIPTDAGGRESRASEFRQVFRRGSVATQKCNGDYQHKNQETQQTKLNHRRAKNGVCALGRPCTFFGESGGFHGNHQNAPNGGNQSDDQKGFGNQNMRANGDTYRVQNLHQHQHNEELVQYPQSLGCNRPMTEIDPKYLARGGDGHKGRDRQQHCENGVDDYLGFAQIVVKVAAQFVFDHIRLRFKSKTVRVVRPKWLAVLKKARKHRRAYAETSCARDFESARSMEKAPEPLTIRARATAM